MTAEMARKIPLFKVRMVSSAFEAVHEVLRSGYLADGDWVRRFEELLGEFVGNSKVTAVSDVSGAITLALYMAGVRPGDDVIVSPMACLAATMPIANLFARPVWCDVDPTTGMIDANRIAEVITPKTKAVLVYHWGGDVADLDEVLDVARKFGLKMIDDASDALGAEYKSRRLGNNGVDFTAYSFQAVKHITTGEGGVLFFSDPGHLEQARWLKRYGIHRPSFRLPDGDLNEASDVAIPGYNFYMTNMAAAIGAEQLRQADDIIARHRANGRYFDRALQSLAGVRLLRRRYDSVSGYWAYSFLVDDREGLKRRLVEHGISCQRLHVRNDLYSCFGTLNAGSLDGVDYFNRHALSIPCGWWVTTEDCEYIADCIRDGW